MFMINMTFSIFFLIWNGISIDPFFLKFNFIYKYFLFFNSSLISENIKWKPPGFNEILDFF